MRTLFLSGLATALIAGCAALYLGEPDHAAARKAFGEADTLLAHAHREEAIRAYGEFANAFPKSRLADDAYLRIAYIYLDTPSPERGWPGWSGASYDVARDTLLALLRRFPNTDRRYEVETWIRLLDEELRLEDMETSANDSVAALAAERQGVGTTLSRSEAERYRLERRLRMAHADQESLRSTIRHLEADTTARGAEIGRMRAENDRMRRMLIDLERRRGGG